MSKTLEDIVNKFILEVTEFVKESKSTFSSNDTPKRLAEDFFSNEEKQHETIQRLILSGVPDKIAKQEVRKFINYWTEPNKTGKKVRWEEQKFFDVPRRLNTWFSKFNSFNSKNNSSNKTLDL